MKDARPATALNLDRRSLLKGATAAITLPVIYGLSPEQVAALGRETHAKHAGVQNQSTQPQGSVQTAEVLTSEQRGLLEQVTETLLPRTDTPGATDAGVVPFLETMLDGWFPPDAKAHYISGLEAFGAACVEVLGKGFSECSPEERSQRLGAAEREAIEARAGKSFSTRPDRLADASFFDVTKWLTVFAYFTSQPVQQGTLGYRIVPGRYDGAVRVKPSK